MDRALPAELQQAVMLAKQARLEMVRNGKVTTICPKCGKSPGITMTERGERTIVSCGCGYIYYEEINL